MKKKSKPLPTIQTLTRVFMLSNGDYDVQTEYFSSEDIFVPKEYLIKIEANAIAEIMYRLAKERWSS